MRRPRHHRRNDKVSIYVTAIVFMTLMITVFMECKAFNDCGERNGKETVSESLPVTLSIQSESIRAGVSSVLKETETVLITPVVSGTTVVAAEITSEPAVTVEEDNETPALRENTLYYINDEGYRCDCPYEYQDYLWKLCTEKGIQQYYELLIAQMYHESGFDPSAQSATNDSGIMQINESNHEWLGKIVGDDDFLDPYTNMQAGVYLMATYLNKYQDVHKALVCYNMGEGKVINDGIYESNYSRGVVEDMEKLIAIEE